MRPVCLLASSYDRWLETVEHFTVHLTERERAAIFGGTAQRAYGLGDAAKS